jgi:neutral trehalase
MPHMIYAPGMRPRLESMIWGSTERSPKLCRTSGITQPPILAIAVERVAHELSDRDREQFLTRMLPVLIRYHEWIYRERNPLGKDLVVCLHSWECGMDDTPYWTDLMEQLPAPPFKWRWLREYRAVNAAERATPRDIQHMVTLAYDMKKYQYNSSDVIKHAKIVVEDLVFNSVLAAANESLERLAEVVGQSLDSSLSSHFAPTRQSIEKLWDNETEQYYSRDHLTSQLIRTQTVATFMPLFAGTASPSRAERLRQLIVDEGGYNVPYPLPSVPTISHNFEQQRYWRGPVWINMNWFIVLGLERYGFMEEAQWLTSHTLGLVGKSGFREYYNPLTGDGLGAASFSWTAALTIDLLARRPLSVSSME